MQQLFELVGHHEAVVQGTGMVFRNHMMARFVRRNGPFHQSSLKVGVRNEEEQDDSYTRWARRWLTYSDWFDFFVSMPTKMVVLVLVLLYTLVILVFAGIYMSIDCQASNPPLSFQESFSFALETATTVGYGLPRDSTGMFFGGCENWTVAIYFQCLIFMIFNGFILGTVMMRVQRANRRARQILFTDKACILCLRGKFQLTFQVFDLQASMPIINSSVRLVAAVYIPPTPNMPAFYQTRVMRVTRPDDRTGSKLWLSVPCLVMHEIDMWSPLAPASVAKPPGNPFTAAPTLFPQPPQRAVDGRAGNANQAACFVCGLAFSTEAGLRRHVEYMSLEEEAQGIDEGMAHRGVDLREISHPVISRNQARKVHMDSASEKDEGDLGFDVVEAEQVRDEIKARLESKKIEVIVIIEGMDPNTSQWVQARHSYMLEDIEFDMQHAPCMATNDQGKARVNLSEFHNLVPTGCVNVEHPIPFASHS